MNVALSPIDTLGRMLHSFNCTAYEIAENNYNNLKKFNFIKTNNVIEQRLQWMSVNLIDCQSGVNILKHSANSIKFEGLTPGNKIKIDNENIVIGATGNYSIDLNNNINIEKIELIDEDVEGILTYSYYTSDFQNGFNNINKIENVFIPCHQFIGENNNIIQEINNIKENITSIAYIKFYLRNADNILYKDKENYYSDSKLNNKVDIASLTDIYQVYNKQNGEWVKDNWLDGYNNLTYNNNIEKSSVFITINDKKEKIDLKEIKQYYIKNPKDINSIKTSVGVIAEIGYWKTILFYDMEENEKLMNKYNYKKENEELIELINNSTEYYRLKEQQDKRNNIYKQYCNELNNIITEAEGG